MKNLNETPAIREVKVKLNFLTEKQLKSLIQMFDSEDAYKENYPPLRAISSGLNKLILDNQPHVDPKLRKMFRAINNLQSSLILGDITKWNEINYKWRSSFDNCS